MSHIIVISDGKPGHENQSLGLAEALQRQSAHAHDIHKVAALPWWRLLVWLLRECVRRTAKADLVIAAGHRTHLSLLAWGWLCQAKTVVLMKPSLPQRWFDLCLIPAHDRPRPAATVMVTKGALNRVQASGKQAQTGLFLIGGPSKHVQWDTARVLEQVEQVLKRYPDIAWTLTTSRRTPDAFLTDIMAKQWPVNVIPAAETDRDWLPRQLGRSEHCWVTSDSISMIYEALTAGGRVGLLALEPVSGSRLAMGINQLIEERWVDTPEGIDLPVRPALAEAQRCASDILQRGWL